MLVCGSDEEVRPILPAVGIDHPVRLVEYDAGSLHRCHLDGAAADARLLVDLLLARHEPDHVLAVALGELQVDLVGEHAERAGVNVEPVRVVLEVLAQGLDSLI